MTFICCVSSTDYLTRITTITDYLFQRLDILTLSSQIKQIGHFYNFQYTSAAPLLREHVCLCSCFIDLLLNMWVICLEDLDWLSEVRQNSC